MGSKGRKNKGGSKSARRKASQGASGKAKVKAPKSAPKPKAKAAQAAGKSADLGVSPGPALTESQLPAVSIIILNLNGLEHLAGCFETIAALDYPAEKRDVLLIDNASTDASVETMRRDFPWVRLITNERNVGFSAGCNQGAAASPEAEVLVFLNNDMRFEPGFLRELVAPVVRGECAAATGKMMSWDGKLLNSAGGGMNLHGIGIQRGYMEAPDPKYDEPRKTLFACGGAMAVDPQVFRDVGGFDEEFFAYYEDIDLGWRMWVEGHECHYTPKAVCYHHHSSTSKRLPKEMIRLLQIRNPLLACFKNYDDDNLRRILPAMLALTFRRTRLVSELSDEVPFRIEHADGNAAPAGVERLWRRLFAKVDQQDRYPLSRLAVADLIGINDLLGRWEHWMKRRADVQGRRKRTDREIFDLFLRPHWCVEGEPAYQELHAGLTSFLGLDSMFEGATQEGSEG